MMSVRIRTLHTVFILYDLSICSPTGSAFSVRSPNSRMTANRLLNPHRFVFASTHSATTSRHIRLAQERSQEGITEVSYATNER